MKQTLRIIILLLVFNSASIAAQLEFVDIRDHIKFNSEHARISQIVFDNISIDLCKFISPILEGSNTTDLSACNNKVDYTQLGALGPLFDENDLTVEDLRLDTRRDSVLSVEIEKVIQPSSNESSIKLSLLLYIHDSNQYPTSSNYFFRRLTVEVNISNRSLDLISIEKDIPLIETSFSFFADAIDRKTILRDFENDITKVFPIATGSFDIRTLPGMDGYIGSMTEDLLDDAQIYPGQPAGLHKSRTDNIIYRHRPFLGIVDNQGRNYKQIGWHYKMTESDLIRGFITHGCMRTEDKDLYQMMSIVFYSNDRTRVKVVQTFTTEPELQAYLHLDHPMPKEDSYYNFINYYDESYLSDTNQSLVINSALRKPRNTPLSEVERYKWCISNGEAEVDRNGVPYILRSHGTWRSALDSYCLTKIELREEPADFIIERILGEANKTPFNFSPSLPHQPVIMNGLCEGSINDASRIFREKTKSDYFPQGGNLSFPIYVANCGCDRFKVVLRTAILRLRGNILTTEAKQHEYDQICPN